MQKEPSARAWHGKSLSAGPLGLRAWIWPSTGGFDITPCTLHKPMGTILDPLKVRQISLRRTLWGFEHRFGHKLGIKSTRSLEATLPAIIFIRDVFHVSLLEQEGAGVRERYKNMTEFEIRGRQRWGVRGGRYSDSKGARSRPPAGDLPLRCSFSFNPFTATG